MSDSPEPEDATVVQWTGFIQDVDGEMLFCRMSDISCGGEDTEYMELHKESFFRLLRTSQPERVSEFESCPDEALRGLIFNLKVDGDAGTTTLWLPEPWTEEEIRENKRRGKELAARWKKFVKVS